uniref:TCF25 ribosome quality control complex subunit n=1 Tax=Saimiri boliviensis boliviensis TaxID=39432 RepID=A0A2K6S892_SAIBB
MRLLESKKGLSLFAFEHSEEYQQAQHKFLVAVESMEPNNIVVLLQTSPYHVDSLLQLSDACRFQEDQEMARDLVERALYSMECAFHPLFSLTSGACRLDYRRPENRSFYLALYKQMSFLEKRGCPRTALEYCKLILSLEPDEDPLCMLLLIDHLALRARNYEYLIRLFQEWEAHRNLSQLPNFAFSVPLAYFLLSQQTDLPEHEQSSAREKASLLIQQALTMFPGVLLPLLDYCSVRPDATVSTHHFFGPNAEISQPPALSQLVSLYLGRSHFLWKEPATMSWLEENVHRVLQAVDTGDPAVEACEHRRKVLYQRAPRNIHRHVILSEIKEAVAALPPVRREAEMGALCKPVTCTAPVSPGRKDWERDSVIWGSQLCLCRVGLGPTSIGSVSFLTFLYSLFQTKSHQPWKHDCALLSVTVAKLYHGGGETRGRSGWGSEPQPGPQQADAGCARHDGQLPPQ